MPGTNTAESRAVAVVTAAYTAQGWTVRAAGTAWHLTGERAAGEVARILVKGVTGDRPVVLLTAEELRAAREQFGWALAVVTGALGDDPVLHTFTAREAVTAAVPDVFRVDLSG